MAEENGQLNLGLMNAHAHFQRLCDLSVHASTHVYTMAESRAQWYTVDKSPSDELSLRNCAVLRDGDPFAR